ncbi:NAD(P)/FAD-dependent oxidoreductase [Altibacter sp. HG106]|uniref:NAD(P)/FAD-dependent oxidoreductase n=1 Tax=Altibacter sp. HG106 TaxID=3023937 RepID=UPI0023505E04|nr:FAD-dependent oxidoreductase [Altibacter sp. HG106]MDC7994314.1 FAD-dependent oxidoreductase [Altibacter sp. HG106]
MQQLDYIIVGLGIGGLALARRLEERGHSFVVFDTQEDGATAVAGGTINPVVLKRFKAVWKASEFFESAQHFYRDLQKDLSPEFLDEIPVRRILQSAEEQNDWLVASDSEQCKTFLRSQIAVNPYEAIKAPFGLGTVRNTLQLKTPLLLEGFRSYLQHQQRWVNESFAYDQLQRVEGVLQYKQWQAKRVIFCEGVGALRNPYFLPKNILPKKGEYITIRAPKLELDAVLKGPFFIIPLGKDTYRVGATFIHKDLSPTPTSGSLETLEKALIKMLHCNYEIIGRSVGMRPTVADRKPLLGWFETDQLCFMNGLGTRGLFMAPLLATWLLDALEGAQPLPTEVDLKRFL